MKKNKKRVIVVIAFLIIISIYFLVTLRGEYLENLEIGKEYLDVFYKNLKFKISLFGILFAILFIATYITTRFIKRGLKKFFDEDKKEMPKLPNKSISFIFSIIISLIAVKRLTSKTMLFVNNTWFGFSDPVFNMDIGYYIFQKPFIQTLLLYFVILIGIYTIYIAVYYIIAFNMFFEEGISSETLKKNTFIKQLIANIILVAVGLSAITFLNSQNVVNGKFLNLTNSNSLYGAGSTDVIIKIWGYRIFAIIIFASAILSSIFIKRGSFKKSGLTLIVIPAYLVLLFIVSLSYDLIYVNSNELDKQKQYIVNNIEFTKKAYDINIDEIEVANSGTITTDDVNKNAKTLENINLLNEELVLDSLMQYKTNLGYYSYTTAKPGIYNEKLVYISPREIISNDTRTYNNKTYEYTHGYGIIVSDTNKVDENGNVSYLQSEFIEENPEIKITEPRIYFGLETNEPIIINSKKSEEYDYPINATQSETNKYLGTAGLKTNFLDRLILSIKEKNIGIAFTTRLTKDSKVITKRNIRERAKTIFPYLKYDEEPYLVITDEGKMVWVLDAYTTSNNYPYSQEISIKYEGMEEKINYIRNSVKVIIDSYTGETKFYITDFSDPIISAYEKFYGDIFQKEEIPQDISKHFIYPKYLYKIQMQILKDYHNIQPEVLYRQDDNWEISKENKTRTASNATASSIEPYYTNLKTINNNESNLGLVIPYTIYGKQNTIAYLVGNYEGKNKLTLYRFKTENAVLGTMQLDTLVEQDEQISKELDSLNVTGTKIEKNIIVVPLNNTLLYVEPIYQVMLNNESQVPVLKRVVVASGNKVAIGNTLKDAIDNLLSQEAISIDIISETKDELIEQILQANKKLGETMTTSNWENVGKDMSKLQELIAELEEIVTQEREQKVEIEKEEKEINKQNLVTQNTINE